MSHALAPRCSLPLILLVVACHDRMTEPGTPLDRAVSMTATSTLDQTGMVAAAAPSSPAVIVRDASGQPVPSVPVSFEGARPDQHSGGSARLASVAYTGLDGIATATWLLPNTPGSYAVVAHAGNLPPITFRAVAVVGPPANITATPPVDQAVLPGVVAAESVSVFVTDYAGNRLAGIGVTFEAGGPPGSTIEHPSAVTNDSGVATPGAWTLGTALGVYTLTARVNGVSRVATLSARVYAPFAVRSVAAGADASCAIALDGLTYCWGAGYAFPTRIQGDERFVSLAVGNGFGCGLTADGAAYCWGRDAADSTSMGSAVLGFPRRITTDAVFSQISAGGTLACGLTADGRAYCWGDNTFGQLGNGTTQTSGTPKAVTGVHRFASLTAGDFHACGVTTNGETYCWGIDDEQQLGGSSVERCTRVELDYYGYLTSVQIPCSLEPLKVAGVPALSTLSAADATCGLTAAGEPFCWGRGETPFSVSSTVRFAGVVATQQIVARTTPGTTASPAWMCGRTSGGAVLCGDAAGFEAVGPELSFSTIVAGSSHQCGVIRDSGLAYCWGSNADGELGNGTHSDTATPRPVQAPFVAP